MKIGRDEGFSGMLKTNKCANGIVNALEIAKENWRWVSFVQDAVS